MKKILVLAVALAVALLVVPVYSFAGPQYVPNQRIPQIPPKKVLTTIQLSKTTIPSPLPDCNNLPKDFAGGDLQFGPNIGIFAESGQVCFDQVYYAGGSISNYMMVSGSFANYSDQPIPDGMGIHIRLIPGGPEDNASPSALNYQRNYDICMRSTQLDRKMSEWPSNINDAHQFFSIVIHSGRAYIHPVSGLFIKLDPDDAIAESNERNNAIHCTSFFHPDEPQCLTGAQVNGGFEGACPVNSREWVGSERTD